MGRIRSDISHRIEADAPANIEALGAGRVTVMRLIERYGCSYMTWRRAMVAALGADGYKRVCGRGRTGTLTAKQVSIEQQARARMEDFRRDRAEQDREAWLCRGCGHEAPAAAGPPGHCPKCSGGAYEHVTIPPVQEEAE